MLADKLPDAAIMVAAGQVVGQALSERPYSLMLAVIGIGVWAGFIVVAVLLVTPREES